MAITMPQQITTVRTVSGIDILAGLWLIVAPFILGYSDVTVALWNAIITGLVVIGLSVARETKEGIHHTSTSWLNVIAGLWLIASPFTLGYANISAAVTNDVILGIIIAALALAGALIHPRKAM